MADRTRNGVATDLSQQYLTPPNLPEQVATQGAGKFGPGFPVLPTRPEEEPRVYEYTAGVNLVTIPRAGYGLADFQTLKNLSIACKEVRLNIELIKREIRALEWRFVPVSDSDANQADVEAATAFWRSPDGIRNLDSWTNALLETMLSIDAVTVWPSLNESGQLQSLDLIDGATMRPLQDFRGRIPAPPIPAYLQILHGVPTFYCDRDRIVYAPFNSRVDSPYGMSPIEFVILAVNLAIRRDAYHVGYYTEGNVPEALVGAPESWSQAQIETWQEYWDNMVAGNISAQRKMHFVPTGSNNSVPVHEFTRSDVDSTEVDEWLMRVACWAYGNSPAEFGLTDGGGLGGAGYTESMENVQYRSMLGPISGYLAELYTQITRRWLGYSNIKFDWELPGAQEDKLQQAQVDQVYIASGVYTVEYVQDRLAIPEQYRPAAPPSGVGGGGFFPYP